MKFRPTEDGYITRAALLQAGQQHRAPTSATCGRARASCSRRRRSPARPPPAGRRSRCPTPSRWSRTRSYVVSDVLAAGLLRLRHQGYFATATTSAPMIAPGQRHPERQRRLQVRRQRLPRPELQQDELLGRRDVRADDPAGHARAGRHRDHAGRRRDRRRALDPRSTAHFDEQLLASSVTGTTFTLRDAQGGAVAATVSYDAQTRSAKLVPSAPLAYDSTYTARSRAAPAASATPPATRWPPTRPGRSPSRGSRPPRARAARSSSSPTRATSSPSTTRRSCAARA